MPGGEQDGAVFSVYWQDAWDRRLTDVFLGMVGDLPSRPEPRHLFDNAGSRARPRPWRTLCRAMAAAARAGAVRDRVTAFTEELHGYALSLFPVSAEPDLAASLLLEAEADGAGEPVQTRAMSLQDVATLERLILTSQIHRDRLEQVIVAARARLLAIRRRAPARRPLRPTRELVRG